METELDLSLCVVTRNREQHIVRFLHSLWRTAGPIAFEAIVVDNHSTDQTQALISREFPLVTLYENNQAESLATASNRALRLAAGRYVSLWSDDLVLLPGCLVRLLEFMDNTPDAGIVGPMIVNSGKTAEKSGARPLPTLLNQLPWRRRERRLSPRRERAWISGAGQILRRELIEEIGILDEGFQRAYHDADYCLRAKRAGWHVHSLPAAQALRQPHPERPALPPPKTAFPRGDLWRYLFKKWLRIQDAPR